MEPRLLARLELLEQMVSEVFVLTQDLYAGARELARERCSCCRRCGAVIPCRAAIRHEGCDGRCFCGLPDANEDTPPEPFVLPEGEP